MLVANSFEVLSIYISHPNKIRVSAKCLCTCEFLASCPKRVLRPFVRVISSPLLMGCCGIQNSVNLISGFNIVHFEWCKILLSEFQNCSTHIMILINSVGHKHVIFCVCVLVYRTNAFVCLWELNGDAISRNIYVSATNCILDRQDRFPSSWEAIMFYLVRALVRHSTGCHENFSSLGHTKEM